MCWPLPKVQALKNLLLLANLTLLPSDNLIRVLNTFALVGFGWPPGPDCCREITYSTLIFPRDCQPGVLFHLHSDEFGDRHAYLMWEPQVKRQFILVYGCPVSDTNKLKLLLETLADTYYHVVSQSPGLHKHTHIQKVYQTSSLCQISHPGHRIPTYCFISTNYRQYISLWVSDVQTTLTDEGNQNTIQFNRGSWTKVIRVTCSMQSKPEINMKLKTNHTCGNSQVWPSHLTRAIHNKKPHPCVESQIECHISFSIYQLQTSRFVITKQTMKTIGTVSMRVNLEANWFRHHLLNITSMITDMRSTMGYAWLPSGDTGEESGTANEEELI